MWESVSNIFLFIEMNSNFGTWIKTVYLSMMTTRNFIDWVSIKYIQYKNEKIKQLKQKFFCIYSIVCIGVKIKYIFMIYGVKYIFFFLLLELKNRICQVEIIKAIHFIPSFWELSYTDTNTDFNKFLINILSQYAKKKKINK